MSQTEIIFNKHEQYQLRKVGVSSLSHAWLCRFEYQALRNSVRLASPCSGVSNKSQFQVTDSVLQRASSQGVSPVPALLTQAVAAAAAALVSELPLGCIVQPREEPLAAVVDRGSAVPTLVNLCLKPAGGL